MAKQRRHRNTIKLKSLLLMLALVDSDGLISAPDAKRMCESQLRRYNIARSNWGTELRKLAEEGQVEFVGTSPAPNGQATFMYELTEAGEETAREAIADLVEVFSLLHSENLV